MFKVKITAMIQNFAECLSVLYFLYHNLCNPTGCVGVLITRSSASKVSMYVLYTDINNEGCFVAQSDKLVLSLMCEFI